MQECSSCRAKNPDRAQYCNACGVALSTIHPEGESRRLVTVVFCDLVGSTALTERLDPESVRAVLARHLEAIRTIVERHGGIIEKFVGDAALAVFGVPQVHEDDALRAVRAAVEMRDAVGELGLEVRIGVNTGEVVAGTGETLVTGDASRPGQARAGAQRACPGVAIAVTTVLPSSTTSPSASATCSNSTPAPAGR